MEPSYDVAVAEDNVRIGVSLWMHGGEIQREDSIWSASPLQDLAPSAVILFCCTGIYGVFTISHTLVAHATAPNNFGALVAGEELVDGGLILVDSILEPCL